MSRASLPSNRLITQVQIRAKASTESPAACKTRTGCPLKHGEGGFLWEQICFAAIQLNVICQDSHPSCGAPKAIYSMPHYNK